MSGVWIAFFIEVAVFLPLDAVLTWKVVKLLGRNAERTQPFLDMVRALNESKPARFGFEIPPDEEDERGRGMLSIEGMRWTLLGNVHVVAVEDVVAMIEFQVRELGARPEDILRGVRGMYGAALGQMVERG